MAKKHTKKYTHNNITPMQQNSPAVSAVAAVAQEAKVPRVSRRIVEDSDFNPDYTPIKQDLKRIGILAATFFVVLLALSFIL